MIKLKNGKCKIKGSGRDLLVELLAAVRTVYLGVCERSQDEGDKFRQQITWCLLDSESPVWEAEGGA